MSGSAASNGPEFERHAYHDYSDATLSRISDYRGGDHERAVNYPIKWFMEEFDRHAWDLVLKEVPVVRSDEAVPREIGEDLVDADVGFIDLDSDRIKIYQMKRSNSHLDEASGQSSDTEEFFKHLKDEVDGFDWDYFGEPESATNIPEEDANPPPFEGGHIYGPPEAREKTRNSEEYRMLNDYVFGGYISLEEENILDIIGNADMDDLVGEDLDF